MSDSLIDAIVPAAGIGSRMQSELPKQYLSINRRSVIEYSIATLLQHPQIRRVIVGLHPQDTFFHQLPISSDPRIEIVTGGETRAQTVWAGLERISHNGWVLVHDAARPCLRFDDLSSLIKDAMLQKEGGILATPVKDTIKQTVINTTNISHTVNREYLWHALTPQMFPVALLKSCLLRALNEKVVITDEASAIEYCGYHPLLIPGKADNIKITHPEDLALATFYLTHQHTR